MLSAIAGIYKHDEVAQSVIRQMVILERMTVVVVLCHSFLNLKQTNINANKMNNNNSANNTQYNLETMLEYAH